MKLHSMRRSEEYFFMVKCSSLTCPSITASSPIGVDLVYGELADAEAPGFEDVAKRLEL